MITVKGQYVNEPNKWGNDYFIFTDLEVTGHADHIDYNTNNRVCAGVSACCYGINRLINTEQFNFEYKSGYFHIWTERTKGLKQCLDKDTVHALNTLVCQLFEIYDRYPKAFKSFELVDIKEKLKDDEQRTNKPSHKKRMGFHSPIQEECSQDE